METFDADDLPERLTLRLRFLPDPLYPGEEGRPRSEADDGQAEVGGDG